MSKINDYIFVLWGEQFDEIEAATFTALLREAGLRVKVVGLSARRARGTRGLVLAPDMTLSKALPLAGQARCIIIPCAAPRFAELQNDPRLEQFFSDARVNGACFVTRRLNEAEAVEPAFFLPLETRLYPPGEGLANFARELGEELNGAGGMTTNGRKRRIPE